MARVILHGPTSFYFRLPHKKLDLGRGVRCTLQKNLVYVDFDKFQIFNFTIFFEKTRISFDFPGFTRICRSGEILLKPKEILVFSKKIVIILKMVTCATLNFVFYDLVEVGEGPPGACYQYLVA